MGNQNDPLQQELPTLLHNSTHQVPTIPPHQHLNMSPNILLITLIHKTICFSQKTTRLYQHNKVRRKITTIILYHKLISFPVYIRGQ